MNFLVDTVAPWYRRDVSLIKAGLLLALAAALFASGVLVEGWRKDAQISALKAAQASTAARQSEAALTDLVDAAKTIKTQADEARVDVTSVTAGLAALKKEFKNGKVAPLPVGCSPDAVRVRYLAAGIDTVDQAIARQRSGSRVPAPGTP